MNIRPDGDAERNDPLPLPKAAAKAARAFPFGTSKERLPSELSEVLKKTFKAVGDDFLEDYAFDLAPLVNRFSDQLKNCSIAESMLRFAEIEASILTQSESLSATIPLVLEPVLAGRPQLLGSGVLLKIVDRTFLLTAAHVTDQLKDGDILIPGKTGFMSVSGCFTAGPLPPSGNRTDDKLDVAFFELDEECLSGLDVTCRPLVRGDVILDSKPQRRRVYSFAGYPWRKGRTIGTRIETAFHTFSGIEAKQSEYDELGLSRAQHIAIRFHRRRSFSSRHKRVVASPLPHGMSGGGVYAWEEEALKEWPVRLPLAGIANEFISEKSLLIATRLGVYVRCIFHVHPDLTVRANG